MLTAACTMTGSDGKAPAPVVVYQQDTASDSTARQHVDTCVMALTGDIMMGTTYPEHALPPDDGAALFADTKDILRRADIAAGNLEGTFCDTLGITKKKDSEHSYSFRTPVEFAPRLKEAGYDFICMANNHALDFGYDGVRSTEAELDKLGIRYAGLQGRNKFAVAERGGVRYGFCAFGHNSYTLRHREENKVKEILDTLRTMADIIIVSFHGGGEGKEYSHLPYDKEKYLNEDRGSLRKFARFCIDNGADVVFGHGPHVVRCVELYKDRLIAYSLGNFCTPYAISIAGISGFAPILEVKTDRQGRFLTGQIHSFMQRKGEGPRKDAAHNAARQIASLTQADVPDGKLRIDTNGKITKK